MRKTSLWIVMVITGVIVTTSSSPALGVVGIQATFPESSSAVTTTHANRAKLEVAIRRIKAILVSEKGTKDGTFDELSIMQGELQGRR